MKISIKRIAENLLISAVVFILFLLFFENRILIPFWLQSVGRMHPLVLHFPIVFLLLALGMEIFRFQSRYKSDLFYQSFTTNLLLAGALSAAIVVIMGLILSKEAGYSGSTVQWHKWTGIAVVLISSQIYWHRNQKWYKGIVGKISTVITIGFLIAAGHLGAGITHGDNFITAPLLAQYATLKVPLDKAVIYTDVIQPIFAAKCLSCHSSEKSKGGLLMDNPANLIKGGKHGKLFIGGNADSSLIMHRINLPEEDKKHMPLAGKPQLTLDEIAVLHKWIDAGASFKKKVIDLPENDPLRLIAAKFLAPQQEEVYDFEAADQKTIEKLSNNYRIVFPFAKGSPALVVNFYNKDQFSSKALDELTSVSKQIIELNLNKMPVKDADLKSISKLENLRVLNLKFTDITGAGLDAIASLKNLKSISLCGTRVNYQNLIPLSKNKSLKMVYLWNTTLKSTDVARLRKINPHIEYVEGFKDDGVPIPLNAPILITNKAVFSDTVHVSLKHPVKKVQIHYTLDGSTPTSGSPLVNNNLIIDKTAIFTAKAFKQGWLESDSVMFNFYKSTFKPDSSKFITLPEDKYKGDGAKTLTDYIVGDVAFYSGKWLGYQKNMEVVMEYRKPINLSSVTFHLIKNTGAGVYPPTQIQIFGGKDKSSLKLLISKKIQGSDYKDNSTFLSECKFKTAEVSFIKVVVMNSKEILKGGITPNKPAWMFVDELFLN